MATSECNRLQCLDMSGHGYMQDLYESLGGYKDLFLDN
jgi:hypothetical protein